MAVQWNMYHIGIIGRAIRIIRGSIAKDGTLKHTSYSDDRSEEVINCVAAKMRCDLDRKDDKRGYIGYDIPNVGKLVLIKPGYDFFITNTT